MKHMTKSAAVLCLFFVLALSPLLAQTNQIEFTSTKGKACYENNSALDGCKTLTVLKLGGTFDQKTDALTISAFNMDPLLLDDGNVKIAMAMSSTGTGSFDWDTGKSVAKLSLIATVSSPTGKYNLGKSCKIPANLNLTTETSGGLTGKRYPANQLSGALKYVDNTFVIQSPVSGSDCGFYTTLIGGATPTQSGTMSIWFEMNGVITPPPAGSIVAEVENNNTASTATKFSSVTNTIEGTTNISDPDYFSILLNAGQIVTVEYIISAKTSTTYSCNPESTTDPKTSISYGGVALMIGGSTTYTTSVTTQKGSCPPAYKEGVNVNATDITTTTYTLRKSWTASSNNQTINFPVQGTNYNGFPTSGTYSLKISVK
ncbi:MAG TPA: hypothetical protein DIW24_05235 [Bacteroidetes bacterium]|nr:hypothetical protein [Bacteroidota bacterium]